jgi:hypothetical protein
MGINFSLLSKKGDISNLRLAAQKITEFSGDYQEFAQWKKSTECALQGTGYDRILTDEKFSKKNPNMSSTVFAQLSLAVIRGSANHVVEEVEDSKDGYAAWQALVSWYEESDLDHETSDALRTKITRLYLDAGGSASEYINRFQTHNRNLDGINDGAEKFSDRTKVQMFLKHIRDPYYKTTIAVIKNQTGQGSLKLIQAIARIRKCELELIQERKSKRRYESPRRKKRSKDEDSDDDPAKVTPDHKRQRKLRRLPPHVQLTTSGRISIAKEDWVASSAEDKSFIQDWNSRVKNKEGTDDLVIPQGTKLVPAQDEHKKEGILRRKTPEMKEKDDKRIHFNLKDQFHDAEEHLDDDSE